MSMETQIAEDTVAAAGTQADRYSIRDGFPPNITLISLLYSYLVESHRIVFILHTDES